MFKRDTLDNKQTLRLRINTKFRHTIDTTYYSITSTLDMV